MLRNEASIRELFYRSSMADRSFVSQDDRKMGYVMGTKHLFLNFSGDHVCRQIDASYLRMTGYNLSKQNTNQ
jgi:hypothetical protein